MGDRARRPLGQPLPPGRSPSRHGHGPCATGRRSRHCGGHPGPRDATLLREERVDDIPGSATGRVIQIWVPGAALPDKAAAERPRGRDQNHTKLHLAVVSIDEVQLLATIRVSGHHRCVDCAWSHRVRLVAISDDDDTADGLPPSAAITLGPKDIAISETVQLPLRGHPVHYPFDRYHMVLGVAYQRLPPGQEAEALAATGRRPAVSSLRVAARNTMTDGSCCPQQVRSQRSVRICSGLEVWFQRPPYVRALAVMLVVLTPPRRLLQSSATARWSSTWARSCSAYGDQLDSRPAISPSPPWIRALDGHHLPAQRPHDPRADERHEGRPAPPGRRRPSETAEHRPD